MPDPKTAVPAPSTDPAYERKEDLRLEESRSRGAGVTSAANTGPDDFATLERRASKPAEELLDGFLVALGEVDTEMLIAIADYRDAIHPNGWMQTCIREYLEVWR